ncbi:hypothetical protein MNB_SV-4-118 [hydrothermal vent metagenome]|uniref:Uncharacterized protein n=1 Tax=hydrothermal vent metagenome TaxID=652676 RepID=A0A1W1E8T3_9ZZZZ
MILRGKIVTKHNIPNSKGVGDIKEFLVAFTKAFAKESRNFFNYFEDLVYAYREKQLHSVTVPAIYKITNNIFTEIPFYRDKKENLGWIDYGVYYGNTLLLIELKHSYYGLNANRFRDSSIKEWETSLNQIKSLKNTDYLKNRPKDNIVKIALNIVTVYTTSQNFDVDNLKEIRKKILKQTGEKNIFIASWKIHQDMMIECEYEKSREYYPAVFVVAKVLN